MDTNKVSFIVCTNDETALYECTLYIKQLAIPEGFSVDIIPIRNAASMAQGYNQGMKASDARTGIFCNSHFLMLAQEPVQIPDPYYNQSFWMQMESHEYPAVFPMLP